jgi:PAS domain S-box-containing protein
MLKKQHIRKQALSPKFRALAEERLKRTETNTQNYSSSPEELLRINHELSLHRIELELQQEELVQSQCDLEKSLLKYRDFYDFAPLGYLTLDQKGVIVEANPMAAKMLGVERSRLNGVPFNNFVVPEDHRVINALFEKTFGDNTALNGELRFLTDVTYPAFKPYKFSGHIVRMDAAKTDTTSLCRIILADITEQKQTESELRRLTRALMATNNCNQAMIRALDEMELLHTICNIMVQDGGYRMAWVGYARDDEAKSISVVAEAGFIADYAQHRNLSWADVPEGRGPEGIAIRTGQSCTVNKMAFDPLFKLWRKDALGHGLASLLTLPLKAESGVFGVLTIYSTKADAFDIEERMLLTALANNLAYGIELLRSRETRARAEKALRKSERNFRSITEHITELVYVADHTGVLTYVSPLIEKLFGYLPHEVIGHNFTEYLPEEKIPEALQIFNDTLLHPNTNKVVKFPFRKKNGSLFSGEVNLQYYQDREHSGMIGLIHDITEHEQQEKIREQYEERLLENQLFLQSIYDDVNHAIFVVDVCPDGSFRYKGNNKLHVKLTGISTEGIAGKTPEELVADQHIAQAITGKYHACIQSGKTIQYEESMPFLGKDMWWETVLNPVRNECGRIYRIIGTSTNITERKQAENQLKKLSVAVEQSPAIVVITNPLGDIEYVNPMFTLVTGYSAEEAIGQNPRILKSGLMADSVYEELWKTIITGKLWHGEFYNKKKNGELYWDQAVISAIMNNDGEITNFVAVKLDITEQKKTFDELTAARVNAEESDRLKSAFLANISHEIRTPMNGILGFSQLMKEPHLSGEEQAEYIDLIQRSGERMLNLINDLIEISRIEAGETMLHIAETPLNVVLRDLEAFFKPQAEKKSLCLSFQTTLSERESLISTDRGKFTQILTNLIQNALKFTTAGRIDVGYTKKGKVFEFYVTDTGIGIPADKKESIFERFRQVDNTLTRNHEGSGLGLSISKAYVTMLGGTIRVESTEGQGSTFIFTLPCKLVLSPKPEHPSQKSQEVLTPSGIMHVLIVEDDAVSTLLLEKLLQSEHMLTLHAVNGQEAVKMARQHPEINLVLMDIKMPVMNGYDATRLIKQFRPELPIIAQSAFTSKEDKKKAEEAGCDNFITKPVRKSELFEKIRLLHPKQG